MSDCKSNMSAIQAFLTLFEEQEDCDVKFCIDSEIIGAHKLFLHGRSEVLYNWAKAWTSKDEPIAIDGLSFDLFTAVLRYIYSDDVNITNTNVFQFLFAAKTFKMGHLEALCAKHIATSLSTETVCAYMEQAVEFNSIALQVECRKVFSGETSSILKKPEFLDISQLALSKFLDSDVIDLVEIDLFYYIKMWMDEQCKQQGLPINGTNMRRVIGDALYKIRFPTMTMQDFSNEVTTIEGLLSDSEMLQTYRKISVYKNNGIPCPFPADFRYESKTIIGTSLKRQIFTSGVIAAPQENYTKFYRWVCNCMQGSTFNIKNCHFLLQHFTDTMNLSHSESFTQNLSRAKSRDLYPLIDQLNKTVLNSKNMNDIMSKMKTLQEALADQP